MADFKRSRLRHFDASGDGQPQLQAISPTAGLTAGGLAVTLSGYNFHVASDGAVPVVQIGGIAATSVVVVSKTSITCVTGAATEPGVFDVTVTVNGQVSTLVAAFTVYAPTIVSLSPAYGPLTGGTEVTIKGFNFDPAETYTVRFGGILATGLSVVDQQTIFVTTPNHALGRVDVVLFAGLVDLARLRNGFQYTLLTRGEDIRRTPGIIVRDALNNAPNTATFTIDGNSNMPLVGEKIEILDEADSDRRLFAGNVQTVTQVYEGLTNQLAWQVTVIDFTWLLNKYRPFGIYKNVSVSGIVKDLISRLAPGFSTDHVQTNLAKVTITFDGAWGFSQCLNALAEAIGGGHWFVDYDQDIHFFHVFPTDLIIPTAVSPITAMTVVEGAPIPSVFSYALGFYLFRSTNVFDNGVESALGPYSNAVALEGTNKITFTNIPVGAPAGVHAVVKRRLYYQFIGPGRITRLVRFAEINNNTTTGFTTWFGATGSTDTAVIALATSTPLPIVPRTVPPISSLAAPNVTGSANAIFKPQAPQFSTGSAAAAITPGLYAFKVTNIYRDGSESLPSPATAPVYLGGANFYNSAFLSSIPIGVTIGSNDVVARKIYASSGPTHQMTVTEAVPIIQTYIVTTVPPPVPSWPGQRVNGPKNGITFWPYYQPPTTYQEMTRVIGYKNTDRLLTVQDPPDWSPERTSMWYLLEDNTTTSATVGPGTGQGVPPDDGSGDIPVWPNPDGPSLEGDDLPEDITALNSLLLREGAGQPFAVTDDQSQIRNRVFVVGVGAVLLERAVAGDTTLRVAELGVFNPVGGEILVSGQRLSYENMEDIIGEGLLTLTDPLVQAIDAGSSVNIFFMAEDLDSQKERGLAELDTNGLPTDGVHEYMIVDTELRTQFQLYMRAYAELELFARPIKSINYSTRDPNTKSGKMVHIDLTDPPCFGDFLIQDVTIDQIHDENDQLMPRYTVTASPVKFDLPDLLLSLLGGNTKGSPINSGSANFDFGGSLDSPAADTAMVQNAGERSFSMSRIANNAVVTIGKAIVISGVVTFVVEDRAYWEKVTTGAVIGNSASARLGTDFAFDHLPLSRMRVKTGSSVLANRLFCGVTAGGGFQDQDAQSSASLLSVGVMYSTPRGDSGWRPFTWDGVTFTVYPAIMTVIADTEYLLEVKVAELTSAGGNAVITLRRFNGGSSYDTFSQTLPLSNQYTTAINTGNSSLCGPEFTVFTREAVTKYIQWSNAYIEGGRPF